MNDDPNTLTLRDYPLVFWIIGFFMLVSGAVWIFASPETRLFAGIDLGLGLLFILLPKALTVTADRATQMVTLSYRGLLGSSQKEIPIREVASIDLQTSHSSDGTTYRIAIICKDGQVFPFHSYYSSGTAGKQKKIERLSAFLGVSGPAYGLQGFMDALQGVKQQLKEQQEALTGSQEEVHLTDGVHWQLQTTAIGGTAITRWFSPDSTFPDGFLYLTQRVAGQKSLGGNLLGGVNKFLHAQSLKIYGFAAEDTPGIDSAEILAVDPGLEPYFTALTSNPTASQRMLNPWVVAPLAVWANRYPLKAIQVGNQLFGQLGVLLSPRGLYISTMGTLIPEAVDELTALGVQLVKAL